MPDARAQQLVTELRGLGLSDNAIGKAVGLNSSAVAQIAGTSARTGAALANQRGAGYGAAVAPALAQLRERAGVEPGNSRRAQLITSGLARSGEIAESRPRRMVTSRSGEQRRAAVRQPTRTVGKSGRGKLLSGSINTRGRAFDNLLAKARASDQQVSVRMSMAMGDGRTKWITVGPFQASWWQDWREEYDDELDDDTGELGDFFTWVLDVLGAGGDLSSDIGEVIGYSAQVEA